MTTRTSQRFLITLKSLKRSRPSVECFDVVRVEFERLVAVRYRIFVLWRIHAHVARGTVAVEHGLWLRRHGDGAGVVLSGEGEISSLVRIVALLLQRSRVRLAFLSIGMSTVESQRQSRRSRKGHTYAYIERLDLFLRQWLVRSYNKRQ